MDMIDKKELTPEEKVSAKIQEIRDSGIDLRFEIVGNWIWTVDGQNTKPLKEELKALKFRWHSKRGKWYFAGKPSGRSRKDFSWIRSYYGSEEVSAN